MKKLIIVVIGLFLLVGCSSSKEKVNKTDALLFKEEYESLNGEMSNYGDKTYRTLEIDKNNPFIYKKASDIIEMIDNKETFAIYFGFSSCPWCRSIIPNLIDVTIDLGIEKIYYVDVKEIRDILELDNDGEVIISKEGTDDYYKLLEKLDSVLDDYTLIDDDGNEVYTNEKRIYAPNIVTVVDGVATGMTTGISNLQEDAYMKLTDEINEESYNKIKCTIECIAEEKTMCTVDKKC